MEKEDAILYGPVVSEMYWEAARFAPIIAYHKLKKYRKKNYKYIVLTRQDRFDLYGKYADILVPLKIEGDGSKLLPNCWRLNGFPNSQYIGISQTFKRKYQERYNIVNHYFPDVTKGKFTNKSQYSPKEMIFKYEPRKDNYGLIRENIPDDKPIVVIAPRYRPGFKRNWKNWQKFYDSLCKSDFLMNNFNFVICGKEGEYIPDKENRFPDINNIKLTPNSSLIGLLLTLLDKAFFTVGSQSAIPNISLLKGIEVLEWGHQKSLHIKSYNIMNTPVTFLEDRKYNTPVGVILKKLKRLLEKKLNS